MQRKVILQLLANGFSLANGPITGRKRLARAMVGFNYAHLVYSRREESFAQSLAACCNIVTVDRQNIV